MKRHPIETLMGAVVILVALFFLFFAYSQADLGKVKGYDLTASFDSVGGLSNGADVSINGIKVGTVLGQSIDPQSYDAVVTMSISPGIHLPSDTVATIDSEGLLGSKYVQLLPGHSRQMIPAGGKIAQTKTYESLEDVIGQVIFAATSNGSAGSAPAPATPPAPSSGASQLNAAPPSAAGPAPGGASKGP